jgi:uncharacterized SAM-binding protein YcdF (DUF218 family)
MGHVSNGMKKLLKILRYLAYAIIGFLIIDLAVVVFFSVYRPAIQKADAIIILGAAINTPALYNRTLEGLELYNKGKADVIVLSGGVDYPKSIPEAQYMQNVILQNTQIVPNLILEENSNSTYENIKNSKKLIPSAHSLIIVSDDFHLARAVIMAKRLGFGPIYWSSPNPVYYNNPELAFYFFREMFAIIDYIPKFIFG